MAVCVGNSDSERSLHGGENSIGADRGNICRIYYRNGSIFYLKRLSQQRRYPGSIGSRHTFADLNIYDMSIRV